MLELTSILINWYKRNARILPWRTDYEPYHVFISELMLQQTQMERGVEYFKRWIKKFPTLFDVANASEEEILLAWEGLGYYRRARYIHETAKKICEEYQGIIPEDKEILASFKGLGDYTVAAICGIAFNQPIVSIDANVERVFSRLFCIEGNVKKSPAKNEIKRLAYYYLPKNEARFYNQALMELGAIICKKKPLCTICPLFSFCEAEKRKEQNHFPNPVKKPAIINEEWIQLIFISSDNKIALCQRAKHIHWGGLFEFYSLKIEKQIHKNIMKEELSELHIESIKIKNMCTIPYNYTNHKNTVSFYKVFTFENSEELTKKLKDFQFINQEDLKNFAFPSPYRKAIQEIFEND